MRLSEIHYLLLLVRQKYCISAGKLLQVGGITSHQQQQQQANNGGSSENKSSDNIEVNC